MRIQLSKIFASLLFLAVASCCAQTPQPTIKIGFSLEATKGERWQTDLDEFQLRAQQLGAQTITRSADGDDEVQFQQVNELLNSGIDVLVLLPHDSAKAVRIIDAAHTRHVPVISYDRLIPNPRVDLYIGFDLFSVGVLQAKYLTEHAPKGNYILLGGSPLDPNSKVVRAGQMKVLQPLIDRGDIKVLADIWVPEWSPTQAYILVAKALQDLKAPLTAILASNDATAGGAIQALEDNKLSGQVLVTGQDADLAAVARLFDDTQLMTVYKPIPGEARAAAEAAVTLARHGNVETNATVPNGDQTTKAILLTPIAVTRLNARDTVFKDGFQKLETVKRALPKDKQSELD
ncbi:MAG TPA: substrate-binding domain-containing protein [Candidatus Sulfotelmatobacter sp.]|nr:substrate-binding domain-containing protein [Candidatus Sulfotelmatobacter sp.]